MAAPLLVCGFRRNTLRSATQPRRRLGVTLLELIIVLAIIGIMASLLFPAIQSARAKAQGTACQNNLRQLGMALHRWSSTSKKFPDPNHWTIDILKYMEEWPLADKIAAGVAPNAELPRPPLYQCPCQSDCLSTVPNVFVCHYVLSIDRLPDGKAYRGGSEITDRPRLSEDVSNGPWYVGPEITSTDQEKMFATAKGPHLAGVFYSSGGGVRGGP